MFAFSPGTVYISNQDGTYSPGTVYISNQDGTYTESTINLTNLEAAFECVARISKEAIFAITGLTDVIPKCCPNRKVAYLATHSRKKRTRKKNFHRAIKILEELAEVNND